MSEFSTIVRIIQQRRLKGKKLLIEFDAPASPGTATGKEQRLIALVTEKPAKTDLELTKDLYGVNSAANRAAFRQLRARVQEKLLNNLPFLDYTDQQGFVARPFEIECRTLLYRASLLISEGETRFSERLLQRCLKKALAAEFTDLAEQAVTRLLLLYSDAIGWTAYEKVLPQAVAIRQQLAVERRSDELYNQFRMLAEGGVAQKRQLLAGAHALIAELAELHAQLQSYTTFYNLYRAQLSYAEYTGCYEDVLKITTDAQQLFEVGQINRKRFDLRFSYFWIVYAHLRTQHITEGLELAERYASAFLMTSTNWFFFYEHYLLLALHGRRYDLAYHLLQQVYKNPSMKKIRPSALERWELLSAYTLLMRPADPPLLKRRGSRLPLSELTMPEYSRDKAGYNVFILVHQALEFLRERRLDAVTLRLESLRKYQQRHLKDSSLLRSRTFLRLLLLLPEAEFQVAQLTHHERVLQHLETLRRAPFIAPGATEIEIVPYEHLWELTLAILRQGPPV
ncbi:hypothetical protein GKZ68_20685 (plasmid) [Hymenobacter sp. BRD128]|uniref:hypothetical protein n=1 Tax=Hymenobacter sp. BRD128 TaxID=2675878 RepID=UPI00156423F2|nr:hypothetical protein [Hymenobacter sp. BRD128]QKG59101.1 hypothetical protein GKZ68_20685 [Hymenobacter sp. BRD128]